METNKIYQGDCLELMKQIKDKSVDLILCDLPYGTTACKWDTIIPFEPLWEQYKRIIKDNGAIVLTASQPFTSALVMSNIKMFKYEWIWESNRSPNFAQAPYMPLKNVENVLVFSFGGCAHPAKNRMKYNPQGVTKVSKVCKQKTVGKYLHRGGMPTAETYEQRGTGYPTQVIRVDKDSKPLHPTQKPVALFEYLIKTYTNEGDLVLDNCAGSFTTAIASENLKRNWICIEKEAEYCAIGEKRIKENRERLHKQIIVGLSS